MADNGEPLYSAIADQHMCHRDLMRAARKALERLRQYRSESAGEDLRIEAVRKVIAGYLQSAKSVRYRIKEIEGSTHAWCVACRGTGLADNACDGCGRPVDGESLDETSFDLLGWLLHGECWQGNERKVA